MNNITAEMLNASSTKTRLQKYWDGYREKFQTDPEHHRHPDTCIGFLSKEKLHEMLTHPNPDMLLFGTGLALIGDDKVAFFADDSSFGLDILPNSFSRCNIMQLQRNYGEGKRFPNVDAIIDTFFKGKHFINSIDELVQYANDIRIFKEDQF